MQKLQLAILDLYDGTPNQGMRCIKSIIERYETEFDYQVFDVRGKGEVPDLSYDVFISTGGPGSPFDGNGAWEVNYFRWLESFWNWTQINGPFKRAFLICHSFQMACIHFGIGKVSKRHSHAFGTFPAHKTLAGTDEYLFDGLEDPFYVADFRFWQVTQPNYDRLQELGAEVIALEKIRPHVPYERAIMGIRWSEALVGVQFHPEADAEGMARYFSTPEKRDNIIAEHGLEKYDRILEDLRHPERIDRTHNYILPSFLEQSRRDLQHRIFKGDAA